MLSTKNHVYSINVCIAGFFYQPKSLNKVGSYFEKINSYFSVFLLTASKQ